MSWARRDQGGWHVARMCVPLVAVLLTAAVATLGVGCGSVGEAEQKLDESMAAYRSSLDEIEELDLSSASKEQVDAARTELQERWDVVERRAEEAGRELDPRLENAQKKMDEALGKAGDGLGAGLAKARESVGAALDEAGSALEDAWSAIKDLL